MISEQNKNIEPPCRRDDPSPWVERFVGLLAPGGETLDLACGSGRHTALLAAHGHPVLAHQTALLGEGDMVTVSAESTQQSATGSLEVLILGGRPIREAVAQYGPFVMNTKAEIRQALEDFEAGRLGTIPADVL